MANLPPVTRRILFVDDNPSFLNMVEKVFGAWSKGSWQMFRAPNAGKALSTMEEQMVDLVILEAELPGLDGLQFLQVLQRRFATIPKAVYTTRPTPEGQTAALNAGAAIYLEKPSTIEAMEAAFGVLNELTKWRPTTGFLGMMWCANLHEVLQIECLNQSSALMEITSGATHGKVYIRDGVILHAHADHHKGTMALAYLLTLKGGEFYLKPFVEPPEVTINGPWEALLMEAAQTRDEEGTAFFKRPVKKEIDIENWEKTGIPPPLPPPPKASKIESAAAALAEELFIPKTEELLVCSGTGSVLFEWQCSDSANRIELMDALQKKARELANSLGVWDRLEIRDNDLKAIARVKPDGKIFARVHRPPDMPF